MDGGNKGNSSFRWQNTRLEVLVKEIDSKIDSCSEHYLNILYVGPKSLYLEICVFSTHRILLKQL